MRIIKSNTMKITTLYKIFSSLITITIIIACNKDDNTPTNSAPIVAAQSFTVAEDIASNTIFATVVATDPEDDALTYTILINSGNLFAISTTGELSLVDGANLDFETKDSHIITVEVSDGQLSEKAIITILVDEIIIDLSSNTWEVVKLKEENATIFTNADKAYTIQFKTDDTFVLNVSPNACSGNYTTQDDMSISISSISCTEVAGGSQFANTLSDLFPKATSFKKIGDELILIGEGEIVVKAIK